jgi:UDPglucose 6-dehydrogenase
MSSKDITFTDDVKAALHESDIVFIGTDWPEFSALPASTYAQSMRGSLFVDCMNVFFPEEIRSAGLEYIGVGR